MALEDLVAAMIAEKLSAQQFLDFFTGLGMGDHPFIVEMIQQLAIDEVIRKSYLTTSGAEKDWRTYAGNLIVFCKTCWIYYEVNFSTCMVNISVS